MKMTPSRFAALVDRNRRVAIALQQRHHGVGHYGDYENVAKSMESGQPLPLKKAPEGRVRTLPAVGMGFFNENHPIAGNMDWFPILKDTPHRTFYYRELPHRWEGAERITKAISTLLFAWITYRMYYNYNMITGEFLPPCAADWTDEELGIPPDDAPDPAYFGRHWDTDFVARKYSSMEMPPIKK